MPITEKSGHYIYHRATTEDTPLQDIVDKCRRDFKAEVTLEEAQQFLERIEKETPAGGNRTRTVLHMLRDPDKPHLAIAKKAKKLSAKPKE